MRPFSSLMCLSSRWSPLALKILVVKSSCFLQSIIISRPKNPLAQSFISLETCSATFMNTGSFLTASFRLRWFSSDMVFIWPSASSPSNIQPSAPERRAYATFLMLLSIDVFGFAAGPVPCTHCLWRSAGISEPTNLPSRASCTLILVRGMKSFGLRNLILSLLRLRCARLAYLFSISNFWSLLNTESALRASRTLGVYMSAYSLSRLFLIWRFLGAETTLNGCFETSRTVLMSLLLLGLFS